MRSRLITVEGRVPRYYIDTDDGDFRDHDDTGHELADAEAARRAAIKALPDMARDKLPAGDRCTFSACVRDTANKVLYSVELNLAGEWHDGRAG